MGLVPPGGINQSINQLFWTIDESYFVHPRNKAQIPFLLAIFCWTGARVGSSFLMEKTKTKIKTWLVFDTEYVSRPH